MQYPAKPHCNHLMREKSCPYLSIHAIYLIGKRINISDTKINKSYFKIENNYEDKKVCKQRLKKHLIT